MGKITRHIVKKGDNLENLADNSDVILVVNGKEYLLGWISSIQGEAHLLYRNPVKDGFPQEAILELQNFRVKSLEVKDYTSFADFSGGQNIALNNAGIPYTGNNERLKFIEKTCAEGRIPVN